MDITITYDMFLKIINSGLRQQTGIKIDGEVREVKIQNGWGRDSKEVILDVGPKSGW